MLQLCNQDTDKALLFLAKDKSLINDFIDFEIEQNEDFIYNER